MSEAQISELDWQKMDGLLPAIIQDVSSLEVLMLGYMSREALEETRRSGKVTFYSRSKGRLWMKGETSGNFLFVESIETDCDGDAILVKARPAGPTCHTGTSSCFGETGSADIGFLGKLSDLIESRFRERPEKSYTSKLFTGGIDRMAQKVGEEGVEVVIAAKNPEDELLKGEAADLLFHLMVLLRARGLSLADIASVLKSRHLKSP